MRGPALEIQAQRLVAGGTVPAGERLQIPGAAAATEDPEHRHQQQKPLQVTHPAAVTTTRNGLEGAERVISSGQIICCGAGIGHWKREIPLTNTDPTGPTRAM